MSKLAWPLLILIAAPIALTVAAPAVTRLASALTPLVLVVGVFVLGRELVHYYTRR